MYLRRLNWGFPGGAVVKNPPASAGDTGLSPGPGRPHMPWSNKHLPKITWLIGDRAEIEV